MSGYCYVKNNSAYRLVVFVFRHLLKTNAGALLHPASTVNKSSGSVFSCGCLDAGFFPYFAIRVEARPRKICGPKLRGIRFQMLHI